MRHRNRQRSTQKTRSNFVNRVLRRFRHRFQDLPMEIPSILLPDPEHLRLDSLVVASDGRTLTFVLASMQTATCCPLCGMSTARIHSGYTRTVLDLPWAGVLVQLRLRVHKFFCDVPECPRTVFTERLPDQIALPARTDTLLAEVRQAPIPAAPPATKIVLMIGLNAKARAMPRL